MNFPVSIFHLLPLPFSLFINFLKLMEYKLRVEDSAPEALLSK